jgi:DNA invertase Pin-like site-specific DNA recombinase
MRDAGVAEEHIYVDKRTGASMEREGLRALLGFARPGDRINVRTLDRLGRNMRETLNLVHDLTERSVFLRTLGDKLAVDTSEPGPGTDMAIALLAMFAQMERIYMLERGAGARAAKEARACRPAAPRSSTRPPAPEPPNGSRMARSPSKSPPNSASAAPRSTGNFASTAPAPLPNLSGRTADQRARPHPRRSGISVVFSAITTGTPGTPIGGRQCTTTRGRREAYGYHLYEDHDQGRKFRAFLHGRAWTAHAEGPKALFDHAVGWLSSASSPVSGATAGR